MKEQLQKPSAEAKALSLFLMAFKTKGNQYKEQSKRINKRWDMVKAGDLDKEVYDKEVANLLESYGGYLKVIEETVWHYVKKTGSWNLQGDDKYCTDAGEIAKSVLKKHAK